MDVEIRTFILKKGGSLHVTKSLINEISHMHTHTHKFATEKFLSSPAETSGCNIKSFHIYKKKFTYYSLHVKRKKIYNKR